MKTNSLLSRERQARRALSSLAPSIALLSILVTNPISKAEIVFEDGFESGSYQEKWKLHVDGDTALVDIVEFPVRSGKYAAHMKTTAANDDRRAELVPLIPKFDWEKEYWVGFSILIKRPVEKAGIVHQHHSIPGNRNWDCGAGPNSFTIHAKGEKLGVLTATNEAFIDVVPETNSAVAYAERLYVPYHPGEWLDVVYRFKYAPDSTGFFQVWLNGNLVFDHNGSTVYRIDHCGEPKFEQQYMKIGLYPASKGGNGEIYYDEIRVADGNGSFEEVAPR